MVTGGGTVERWCDGLSSRNLLGHRVLSGFRSLEGGAAKMSNVLCLRSSFAVGFELPSAVRHFSGIEEALMWDCGLQGLIVSQGLGSSGWPQYEMSSN